MHIYVQEKLACFHIYEYWYFFYIVSKVESNLAEAGLNHAIYTAVFDSDL